MLVAVASLHSQAIKLEQAIKLRDFPLLSGYFV